MEIEVNNPTAIEEKSMQIIAGALDKLDCTAEELITIKRVIHATAEPELARQVRFSPDAVNRAKNLLRQGADIITDVSMLQAGINKVKLAEYGGQVKCFIADSEVRSQAEKTGLTRSIMAMRKAIKLKQPKIFAIGNAPTALFELIRLYQLENQAIDFLIGTPVGFVGAAESKAELNKQDFPFITLLGRRGGSAVAAAIVNSLLYQLAD